MSVTVVNEPLKSMKIPRYSRRRRAEPLHIYTDGCALRNGQPGAKGGWAIVYEFGDFQDDYGYCTDDPQTNNRFELEAIGHALERSLDSGGEYDITIFTDSKYAINSIKHWIKKWKQNGWRNSQGKRVHNDLLIQDIDCMLEDINYAGGSVHFEYVEAHSGNWFNEKADKLAKKAAFKNPLYSNYDFNYRK